MIVQLHGVLCHIEGTLFKGIKARKISFDEAKQIGDKLKVDWKKIEPSQFCDGMKVELEHADIADSMTEVGKVAHVHLKESPDYYRKLKKMEAGFDKSEAFQCMLASEKVLAKDWLEKGQFNMFGGEDVKQPGKRGGKWYRSKETGKVVYGTQPVEKPKQADEPKKDEKLPGTHAMAQRITNAESGFVDSIKEQFKFSDDEAKAILERFKKEKIVKLDVAIGRYQLKDGRFWDKKVMQNVLKQAGPKAAEKKEPEKKVEQSKAKFDIGDQVAWEGDGGSLMLGKLKNVAKPNAAGSQFATVQAISGQMKGNRKFKPGDYLVSIDKLSKPEQKSNKPQPDQKAEKAKEKNKNSDAAEPLILEFKRIAKVDKNVSSSKISRKKVDKYIADYEDENGEPYRKMFEVSVGEVFTPPRKGTHEELNKQKYKEPEKKQIAVRSAQPKDKKQKDEVAYNIGLLQSYSGVGRGSKKITGDMTLRQLIEHGAFSYTKDIQFKHKAYQVAKILGIKLTEKPKANSVTNALAIEGNHELLDKKLSDILKKSISGYVVNLTRLNELRKAGL